MKKNPILPDWFTQLINKYQLNQSWLTINVNDAAQLSELSKDQIAFFMNMVKLMQTDLPESQLADEILSLGPREVEEKVTAIDVVLARSQQVGLQINTINHQVNLNSTEHVQTKIVHIGTQYNFFGVSGISTTSSASLKSDGPFRDCFGLPAAFEDFTGREDSLALLEANAGQSTVISHPKKTVSGTGGIGKTQLAVTFAHSKLKQYRETQGKAGYRSIIWFIAGTDEGIDNQGLMIEQMNRLGQQLGFDPNQLNPDALVKEIFLRLSEEYGPYLVVYDNAQNMRSIKHYLPPSSVHVIITTRNNNERDWDQTFKPITLSVFSPAEAHAYIKKVLCRNHPNLYQEAEASALAKALGYFPLALTQALAYITTENIRITEYLEAFAQQKEEYLLEPVPQGDPYQEDKNPSSEEYDPQKSTIWAVIQLSLKKVTNADSNQILKVCAYLAPEAPIDLELLAYWATNPSECQKAVSALRCYSLLENVELERHVRVHQLVQEILRLKDDKEDQGVWLSSAAEFMRQHSNQLENPLDDESRRNALFPHLQTVLRHFEELIVDHSHFEEVIANLQFHIGNAYNRMGNASQAKRYFEMAIKIFEIYDNKSMLARTLMNLGNQVLALGDFKSAKDLLERALAINENIYPPGHRHVADTLTNLGNVHLSLGNVVGAKELFERALAISELCQGESHLNVAIILTNLGLACAELGDDMTAKVHLERALVCKESDLGPNHPEVATTLSNLGQVILRLGNAKVAQALLERALSIEEHRTHGSDDPKMASILTNLGDAYLELGNISVAKKLLKRSLDIKERVFNSNYVGLANTLVSLGSAYFTNNETKDAQVMYSRALIIHENTYGPMHPKVAVVLMNLGNTYLVSGDALSGQRYYKRALNINEKWFGAKHFEVGNALMNLGNATRELGDAATAQGLLERALAIDENHFGRNHPNTALTRFNLGLALKDLGKHEAALAIFQHSARVYLDYYGERHQRTINAQNMVYKLQQDIDNKHINNIKPNNLQNAKVTLFDLISNILAGKLPPPYQQLLCVAESCFESEMISEALTVLEFCLEMETSIDGLVLRARCQLRQCDFSGASETASLCQALTEENHIEVKALLSEIEKSQLQAMQWQEEIISLQSQLILSVKDQITCVKNLRRLNRFEEALKILDAVIASKPSVDILGPAYFRQAQCYFKLRRYEEAQKNGEESYRLKEHPRVEELINKVKFALEITPKLSALLDKLTHSSTRTLTM